MELQHSCKEAIASCLDQKTFAVAHLYNDDNRFYSIEPGDIFFINQYESHHLTYIDEKVHERIVLSIFPDFLKQLSSGQTNLDNCFSSRDTSNPNLHKRSLNVEEQKLFQYFIHKLVSTDRFGADLIEKATFTELMVFLNKIFSDNNLPVTSSFRSTQHQQVDRILTYINQHIQNPLTIEELSENFYLSPSYLCRIFKSATRTTINKYIIAKRITIAKSLLAEGKSVNEACEECGFNDYSNFLKTFTKAVGISPKKYSQFSS